MFILVRSTITSTEIVEIEPKAEVIWVKISIKGSRDFYLCCHYSPSVTDKTYITFLSDSLHRLGNHNGHIFIGGDFNLPDWDWEQNQMKNIPNEISNHKEFINLLNDNGLTQLVTKPTRLENTLDRMITNNPTRGNRTEILPDISDHEIVLCELDIRQRRINKWNDQYLFTEPHIGNC